MPALRALVFLLLALGACTPDSPTAKSFCLEDSDCGGGESCIADLTLGTSYCGLLGCTRDRDCPPHQTCRSGVVSVPGDSTPLRACIDRIRACAEAEACNGLDDDCDGVVDGPECTPITACLDDEPCGVFACTPAINQPLALCAPENASATVEDYEVCTSDDQCRNGTCETGRCAPLCRPARERNPCRNGFACARAVGSGTRPDHNTCQPVCDSDLECSAPQRCVWRDVYQGQDEHGFVCSIPDPGRLENGASCPRNDLAGDDQCASGLCFGCTCTRPCDGANADCSDVGPDAICQEQELRYGGRVFQAFICSRRGCA